MSIRRFLVCHLHWSLEIQSALTRRVGESLDAAVKEVAATVKNHVLNALILRALGNELADGFGRIDAGAGLQAFPSGLLHRGGGNKRCALIVIDHLCVDVLGRAEYREPLAAMSSAAKRPTHTPLPPLGPVSKLGHPRLRYF